MQDEPKTQAETTDAGAAPVELTYSERSTLITVAHLSGITIIGDLATVRRDRRLSQATVAATMGTSIATISRMERSPLQSPICDLVQYASAIGCRVSDLLAVEPSGSRSWSFTVHGTPKTKRGADKGRGGAMHSDPAAVAYEQAVAGAAMDAGLSAGSGPVSVTLVLYLPTKRRKDADRVASAVFDGLKRAGKAALADDNLMVIQDTRIKLGGIDRLHPRAEITIREIVGGVR